jgi:dynactin complex subunit
LQRNGGRGHEPNEMVSREEVAQMDTKNKQINELSDMVKVLLEEQKQLKDKLEQQENKLKDMNETEKSSNNPLQRK